MIEPKHLTFDYQQPDPLRRGIVVDDETEFLFRYTADRAAWGRVGWRSIGLVTRHDPPGDVVVVPIDDGSGDTTLSSDDQLRIGTLNDAAQANRDDCNNNGHALDGHATDRREGRPGPPDTVTGYATCFRCDQRWAGTLEPLARQETP